MVLRLIGGRKEGEQCLVVPPAEAAALAAFALRDEAVDERADAHGEAAMECCGLARRDGDANLVEVVGVEVAAVFRQDAVGELDVRR